MAKESKGTPRQSESEQLDARDVNEGFSLVVSKPPEDIISVIKQVAPSLRPSERRVAEAVLSDVKSAL